MNSYWNDEDYWVSDNDPHINAHKKASPTTEVGESKDADQAEG